MLGASIVQRNVKFLQFRHQLLRKADHFGLNEEPTHDAKEIDAICFFLNRWIAYNRCCLAFEDVLEEDYQLAEDVGVTGKGLLHHLCVEF